MLVGKVLLFDNTARNPFFLKQQLDYYGAMGCGFQLDAVTVDPSNERGRVLNPDYIFDLVHAYGGQVFGWSRAPIDLSVISWLRIPGYLIWQDQLLTGVNYTPVVDLFEIDPANPPAEIDTKHHPTAFLGADLLLEMTYLPPARVYALADWLKKL